MSKFKPYKCVNCGKPATALYKSYGPSVLKLTKCEKCGGIVDKYVEYDPVIVMIDLVLMSREAQRHVIYNTEFKPYWKLFIILMMLETYGIWRNDSLISIAISAICNCGNDNVTSNCTQLSLGVDLWRTVPESWLDNCWAWTQPERADDNDLFIWEKDFYIQFISTFSGIAVFLATTYSLMKLGQYFSSIHRVPLLTLLKAFSLAHMSILFTLPMLVWGNTDTEAETRTFHYVLVYVYSSVLLYHVFTVVYGSHMLQTILVLIISNYAKFLTTFNTTPYVRNVVS